MEDLLKETRTLHLLPELIGTFYIRYPKRYNLLMEALKEEKTKAEALKDKKTKLDVAKFNKSPIVEIEIDYRDCAVLWI